MSKPWSIDGTELVFRDSEGIKWAYQGNLFEVSLTGNVGIIAGFCYYKDEEGETRWLPRQVVEKSPAEGTGRIWVENSKISYVGQGGERFLATSASQPYLKE